MANVGAKLVDGFGAGIRGGAGLTTPKTWMRMSYLVATLALLIVLSVLSTVVTLQSAGSLFLLQRGDDGAHNASIFGTPRALPRHLEKPSEHVAWAGIDIGRKDVTGALGAQPNGTANSAGWAGRGLDYHSFVWHPAGDCVGSFATGPAEHSHNKFPYAVIRDALVDSRITSRRHLRLRNPELSGVANHRIILYLSVHLSAQLTATNATAAITVGGRTLHVRSRVDYVHRVDSFLIPYREYTPGRLNQKRKEVSEWQVAISLFPDPPTVEMSQDTFTSMLLNGSASADNPAILNLSLPLIRYDGKRIRFRPWMHLGCAVGWLHPSIYPPIPRLHSLPKCVKSVEHAKGAVVLSGSALYGAKNRDAQHFREIAHFAVRALYGPVLFSTVVMSVVVNETVSGIMARCGEDGACRRRHALQNVRHLEWIQRVVDAEMDDLRVSRGRAPTVLLVPSCRLGSHVAMGDAGVETERDEPCGACHQHGQYHATFFTYALMGAYYKWAMLYDMDEVVMDDPRRNKWRVREGNASDILDMADKRGVGYVTFPWLHFLGSVGTTRVLTREVMRKFAPRLRVRHEVAGGGGDNVTVENCLGTKDITGKAGVRCDVGVGFTIHASVVGDEKEDASVLAGKQVHQHSREIRTWHARLDATRGDCAYVYNFEGRELDLDLELGELTGELWDELRGEMDGQAAT